MPQKFGKPTLPELATWEEFSRGDNENSEVDGASKWAGLKDCASVEPGPLLHRADHGGHEMMIGRMGRSARRRNPRSAGLF